MIYVKNILKYQMLYKWQKATKIHLLEQQETKNICWDCFQKTEQKPGFILELLESTMSEWTPNLTKIRRRNNLQI